MTYERLDRGYERYDAVWIKVVCARSAGSKTMVRRNTPSTLWGSAFKIRVQDHADECDGGRRSEGKTSRKEFTLRNVQIICMMPILEISPEIARKIYDV